MPPSPGEPAANEDTRHGHESGASSIRTALLSLSERSVVQWALPEGRRAVTFPVGRPATNSLTCLHRSCRTVIADSEERWRAMQHYVTGDTCRALLLESGFEGRARRGLRHLRCLLPGRPPDLNILALIGRGVPAREPKGWCRLPTNRTCANCSRSCGPREPSDGTGSFIHVDRHGSTPRYLPSRPWQPRPPNRPRRSPFARRQRQERQRGHPWVFSGAIARLIVEEEPPPGDVVDREGDVHRMGPLGLRDPSPSASCRRAKRTPFPTSLVGYQTEGVPRGPHRRRTVGSRG